MDNNWSPEKIWRVAKDIKDAPKINLLSLLTAFLSRMLLEDRDIEASGQTYSEKVKQSGDIIDTMHRDAVAFCTDGRATDLRRYLHE